MLNMLFIKLDFFIKKLDIFILSGCLRELKKKGKDHPVIHKTVCGWLRELFLALKEGLTMLVVTRASGL